MTVRLRGEDEGRHVQGLGPARGAVGRARVPDRGPGETVPVRPSTHAGPVSVVFQSARCVTSHPQT